MDAIPRRLYQVGDGLPWDWEPDAHEGTCWHDKDVPDFVEGSSLVLFENCLMRRLEAEDSDIPDHKLIELVLRDVGLEYIPKRAICVQKYYMRQRRGLYMGFNTSVQQFVQRLNDLNRYLLYFPEENPKQLDQDEIIEILDQAKALEWHEAMVNANINIFEMSYEESVSYFKWLENLEKIRRTNGSNPSSLPVDNKKWIYVTSSKGKSSKNHKGSNLWCHYCDKNKHNTADCRAIAKFKQQKKACFEAKAGPGKKSLVFLVPFEEINALKRKLQLKPEKTASSKKSTNEYWIHPLLSNYIYLTTSSDEDTSEEYLFTSSKPFSSSKTKLTKSSDPTNTELVVSLIVNNEEHLLRALADTGASSSSIILEAYTSAPFIKIDDNNTTTWITMGGKFTTTKTGICLWHFHSQSSTSRNKYVLIVHFI
jgi:hypothetical protein